MDSAKKYFFHKRQFYNIFLQFTIISFYGTD